MAVDPRQRLREAQVAAREGRHKEALRGYVWFHDNSLKHEPSLYGVRLSFALSYWVELGKSYPQALRALKQMLAKKTAALRNGKQDRELFHDVASINEYLKRPRDTYRLFAKLHVAAPKFAAKCAALAMPAILDARDFALARRYTPDPEVRLKKLAESFDQDLQWARKKERHKRATRDAFIHIYSDRVNELIKTLRGTRERERAVAIRKAALKAIAPRSVRNAVATKLYR